MSTVVLMEFNRDDRNFHFLKEIELCSIPTSNDKIVIDIEGIGYIFRVYDVHYSEESRIDINLIRLSTITDYLSTGFVDID
ncbi:hypothetical protein D3C78_1433980 [compost metagenome]